MAIIGHNFDGQAQANARVTPCADGSVLLACNTHSAQPQPPVQSASWMVTSDKTAAEDSISRSSHAVLTIAAGTPAAGHFADLAASTFPPGRFPMASIGSASGLRDGPSPLSNALFSPRCCISNCWVQRPPALMNLFLISDMYAGADRYLPFRSRPAAISNRLGDSSSGCQPRAAQLLFHQAYRAFTVGVVVAASSFERILMTASSSMPTMSSETSDPRP